MARYGQPRRLNAVSIAMLIAALAGAYAFYVFFPVYWDAWTVDHQLREGAAQVYNLNRVAEPERTKALREMLQKVQADSIRLGNIKDPTFEVTLDIEDESVLLHGDYDVTIVHPIGNFVTVLHMKRVATANIKRVQWE